MLKRLVCWLVGHAWKPQDTFEARALDIFVWRCVRCGKESRIARAEVFQNATDDCYGIPDELCDIETSWPKSPLKMQTIVPITVRGTKPTDE